jgi:glycosyltransferase involved in cell wall biosynthesis
VKPILLATGHAPSYRVGAFARLHEREGIEVALFGGRPMHGGAEHRGELPFPHRCVRPRELARLAASQRYRGVICPTGGRIAPAAAWGGARHGGVPLILWASLWAHPRSAAHAFSYLPLRRLYRSADAVVTYGPHVNAYVRARGARNVHIAPQSVDNDFWRSPLIAPPQQRVWPAGAPVKFLFVGRPAPEKGLAILLEGWRAAGLAPGTAALVVVGECAHPAGSSASPGGSGARVVCLGRVGPAQLRDIYAAADVLVVPSVRTRTFREPWGLVVNEAMNRGLPVIASEAVGAAAGGLVRDGRNGLIVPAGDPGALARAIGRLAADVSLRARLGNAGAEDVLAFSHDAWAQGFSAALATVGLTRGRW